MLCLRLQAIFSRHPRGGDNSEDEEEMVVASFVSRANSGYTNRSDDRESMASLASMMSGRVRLQCFAGFWAAWAACKHPLRPAKDWWEVGLEFRQGHHAWTTRAMPHCCSRSSSKHACFLDK